MSESRAPKDKEDEILSKVLKELLENVEEGTATEAESSVLIQISMAIGQSMDSME